MQLRNLAFCIWIGVCCGCFQSEPEVKDNTRPVEVTSSRSPAEPPPPESAPSADERTGSSEQQPDLRFRAVTPSEKIKIRPTINGKLTEAIAQLEEEAATRNFDWTTQSKLADYYAMAGYRSKAAHLWRSQSNRGSLAARELVMLTDYDRRHPEYRPRLEAAEKRTPNDISVNLGLAIEEFSRKEFGTARRRLERIVLHQPDTAEAQGLLGEILVDTDPAALQEWYEQVPEQIRHSPDVLIACGLWSTLDSRHRMAIWCYSEAAKKIPASYRVSYLLSSALTNLNAVEAPQYRQLTEQLFQLREQVSRFLREGGKDASTAKELVDLLEKLDRPNEAYQWLRLARSRVDIPNWEAEAFVRLSRHSRPPPVPTVSGDNIWREHPLNGYPKFEVPTESETAGGDSTVMRNREATRIQFIDQAQQLGLNFAYKIGRPPNTTNVRMFESTGGGIAVIDYDLDSQPDLFFTQGADWPDGSLLPSTVDQASDVFFRQVDGRFTSVEEVSGIANEGAYGQGCAAGDVNNDGFPDLYVANIGQNRLLLNNGDGTFRDATEDCGFTSSRWTTSCLIADLDGDSNPDIYDVNYLEGDRVFRDHCNRDSCSTRPFKGAQDEVHWSQDRGIFHPSVCTHEGEDGPGLGIITLSSRSLAADHDLAPASNSEPISHNALSLFVGNDGQPDYLLTPVSSGTSVGNKTGKPRLQNDGFARGVAVNAEGKYTSSMGIAAADVNRDGKLDFLVTNYSAEANSLFVQKSQGFFVDQIADTGLRHAGLPYVGWGTQFFDPDCDGDWDLFVANGHVATFEDPEIEYAMPMQIFRHDEGVQFTQLATDEVGDVFQRPIFGRCALVTDWNCDGAPDVVVGTLASAPLLLTNLTEPIGKNVSIRLHAKSTARDAIGTAVTLVCGSQQWRAELTAGDGFHGSQERMIHFGLGTQAPSTCQIMIEWPGGSTDEFEDIPVSSSLDAVEGSSHLWVRPK